MNRTMKWIKRLLVLCADVVIFLFFGAELANSSNNPRFWGEATLSVVGLVVLVVAFLDFTFWYVKSFTQKGEQLEEKSK